MPAFSMRFLIPALSNKPKTVKRNRVTTSWSLGESRSKSDMSNRHKRQNIEADGNISLRHHPPFPSPCQDPCHREKPRHRWRAAGPDTIVWYRRDMVWMGCLEHPFAKWNSSIGSRCLQAPCSTVWWTALIDGTYICRSSWLPICLGCLGLVSGDEALAVRRPMQGFATTHDM